MRFSRLGTALIGLSVGLAVSLAAWVYFDTFLLFLFLPFVPFFFRRGGRATAPAADRSRRRCPQCGFETREPEFEYCPRDGTRLR